eukprot:m.211295 g.211295  ORF g.211295 m.211295 type:complete len:357 (-) comp25502_c0_seq1:79-1149(-)
MPRRGHDDRNRNCGLQCGWCLLIVGVITAIFTISYVVAPAFRGMAYEQTTCTVENVDIGTDNMFNCQCTSYCRARAPCVQIFVEVAATSTVMMAHSSLTSLEQFSPCSIDNRQCATESTANNVAAAINYVDHNFPANKTLSCWYHNDNVVFAVDLKMSDIVDAIVFPAVALFVGLCLVCVNSTNCRDCGGACCLAMFYPVIFLFYRGPKLLYQRVMHPNRRRDNNILTPLNSTQSVNGDVVEQNERLPLYASEGCRGARETVDSPPTYNEGREADTAGSLARAVGGESSRATVAYPSEDPPPYVPGPASSPGGSPASGRQSSGSSGLSEPELAGADSMVADANDGYLEVNFAPPTT